MAYQQGVDGGLRELALFAGAGGGVLGGKLLGWRTVCAVELEPYAASVLVARQNDGILSPFPVWDNVCTFEGRPWRGRVDVVSGGFPCQDISAAGSGAGIDGARSGLWSEFARIIGEVRPRYAFVENSPMLVTRGLGRVLGDLAALGYDCRWTVLGAADVGAPHRRDRFWLIATDATGEQPYRGGPWAEQDRFAESANGGKTLADAQNNGPRWREQQSQGGESAGHVADAEIQRCRKARELRRIAPEERASGSGEAHPDADCQRLEGEQQTRPAARSTDVSEYGCDRGWRPTEPGVGGIVDGLAEGLDAPWADGWEDGTARVANGIAARAHRLKAIGNGQVPQCAAEAWRILTG